MWEVLCNSTENDHLDFKGEWYSGEFAKINMIHDILCLSNSLTNSASRYIVIGVSEHKTKKDKNIIGVADDKNCKTSEEIVQILRGCMNVIPNIEVIRENVGDDKQIDIIKITPYVRDLPYVLNKDCEVSYKDKNNNNKTMKIVKNGIYSKDSSRNTPKTEFCSKEIVEELFARKRGEHLPIMERFATYLNDIENWKRPKRYDNEIVTEDAYYYTKNHKFKIVIRKDEVNSERFSMNDVAHYLDILADTCLEEGYWNYRNKINHSCYDDGFTWFNVELWADNTLLDIYSLLELFIKYYFCAKGFTRQTFYLPAREDMCRVYDFKSKEDIEKSLVWKVCKLFYCHHSYSEIPYDDGTSSFILGHLNYEYLSDMGKYIEKNKDWIYNPPVK